MAGPHPGTTGRNNMKMLESASELGKQEKAVNIGVYLIAQI